MPYENSAGTTFDRMLVTYRVTTSDLQTARIVASDIANEQTVECPPACIPEEILENAIVGRVETVKQLDIPGKFHIEISYHPHVTGFSVPQVLNVLFGNISLKNNVRIIDLNLGESLYSHFLGPRYGISGLREICGAHTRPLACTALKPLGSSVESLAHKAYQFALGGIDIIKDDHGLADQSFHPFAQRVKKCAEAIALSKSKTLYMPMISGRFDQIEEQIKCVIDNGLKGILIAPMLVGFDTVRYISQTYPLVILGHPSWTGGNFASPDHGLDPAVLLGTLFRLVGADASIFPNSGGRFPFTQQECSDIADALRNPKGAWKPSFPSPAGGMQLSNVTGLVEQFGPDTLLLLGGSLMEQPQGITAATQEFMQALTQYE